LTLISETQNFTNHFTCGIHSFSFQGPISLCSIERVSYQVK
jgi:hypothetical protein